MAASRTRLSASDPGPDSACDKAPELSWRCHDCGWPASPELRFCHALFPYSPRGSRSIRASERPGPSLNDGFRRGHVRCPSQRRLKPLAAPRIVSRRPLPTDHAHPVLLYSPPPPASQPNSPMKPIFVTGASGFIGTELLLRLRSAERPNVTCLTRDPEKLAERIPPLSSWKYVRGDLSHPSAWSSSLQPGSTVIHLAAATGKASAGDLQATNVDGTRVLLSLCESQHAEKLIHVSSIAAKFPDRDHYHYAETKVEAERMVRAASCPFVIIRPTMVFGAGSPVLRGLTKLAGGRVGVVPGDGRSYVQPVHVSDVAAALLAVIDDPNPPINETVELGGPDPLSIGELLSRIRKVVRGHSGRFVHLPLRPLRELLAAAESVVGSRLPLTAGQLASFANDGTAAIHPWTLPLRNRFRSVDEMLADLERA